MYFYLDKILAKKGTAKCIAVSEKEISQEELEARKKCFNVQEVLIFEGIDIPHKFKYNEKLNTIEEVIEIIEDTPLTLSDEIEEIESDFDEEVEIDPEKQYFYLDKAFADKFYKSQVIAVFPQPLKNPTGYFQREVYQHYGKDIPFYISVDEGSIVREATEYEKYTRGQRKLNENEVVLKEEIIILNEGQYLDEEKQEIITIPCPSEYLVKEWDKKNHIWIDLTTDLDRVRKQYREYEPMNTPLTFIELEEKGLKNEYINLMRELEKLIIQFEIQNERNQIGFSSNIAIPSASEELENFKDIFNKFF